MVKTHRTFGFDQPFGIIKWSENVRDNTTGKPGMEGEAPVWYHIDTVKIVRWYHPEIVKTGRRDYNKSSYIYKMLTLE